MSGKKKERLQPLAEVVPDKISTRDDLLTHINGLTTRVNELADREELEEGGERENLNRAFADLATQVSDLKTAFGDQHREAPTPEASPFAGLGALINRLEPPKGMNRLHFNLIALSPDEMTYAGNIAAYSQSLAPVAKARGMNDMWRNRVYELQALNDMLLLADLLLTADGNSEYAQRSTSRGQRIKTLKLHKDWDVLTKEFQRNTALDTATAGDGLEWVPTMWSSRLIELIQSELVIANLFDSTVMPTPTYKLPLAGADMIAYKVAENVEESGGTAIPSNTFGTSVVTLNAIKLATRIMASSEITEDSVIAIAPRMTSQIAKAIARAKDDAILNGDTTSTHQDADVTSAMDRRKSWKGLRNYALAYGTTGNVPVVDAGGSLPLTFADLMRLKKNMAQYGARPSQGAWVVGYRSIIELMQAKDANGNQVFMDTSKYGAASILLTGELGRVAGSPVILSEFCREDLGSAGVNTGVGANDITGCIQYVNRDCFTRGERRTVTLARSAERYIEMDQLVFVGTWRGDFKPYYAQTSEKIVGIMYNVA